MKQLETQRDKLKKEYDELYANRVSIFGIFCFILKLKRIKVYLFCVKNELEDLLQQEKDLFLSCQEWDKKIEKLTESCRNLEEEISENMQNSRELRAKIKKAEAEIAQKSEIYALQKKKNYSGLQMKNNEVESKIEKLRNEYLDLDNHKHDMHIKLIQMTDKVKDTIKQANELTSKIQSTALPQFRPILQKLTDLQAVNLHVKYRNLVKEYRDNFDSVRNKFKAATRNHAQELVDWEVTRKLVKI